MSDRRPTGPVGGGNTTRPERDAAISDASWRDRALERSLRVAREKAISRSDRFIATAMEILQETGRTDFTVQELVDRSHTSLRSFYQYFAGKDELLLAILEERMAGAVAQWRQEIEGKSTVDALKTVVTRIYGSASEDPTMRISRALAAYHIGLASTRLDDYVRAHAPVGRLIRDLVKQGVEEGALRSDIPPDQLTIIVVQTVLGAAMMNVLRVYEPGDRCVQAETLWEFCRVGLMSPAAQRASQRPRGARH